MNLSTVKTALLLGLLTILFIFVGGLLGGRGGMIIAFVFAVGLNFFSYWFSDKIVLKMYKAKEVSEANAPKLYTAVRRLASKGQMPMPKVYIIESAQPNAFATGRNPEHAAVAATTGILNMLNEDELEGVMAHELSHIYGRDTLISTVAASLAGAVMILADMARWSLFFGGGDDDDSPLGLVGVILAAILAPLAALLIQMAVSRSREFTADKRGAALSGKPMALATALQKISRGVATAPMNANPATSHMFILNPVSAGRKFANMFSTHPPVEERVRRLELMSRGQ